MITLQNQVIIITGGAAGIGGGITRKLISLGASAVIVDINEDAGNALQKEFPDKVAFLNGDVPILKKVSTISLGTLKKHYIRLSKEA